MDPNVISSGSIGFGSRALDARRVRFVASLCLLVALGGTALLGQSSEAGEGERMRVRTALQESLRLTAFQHVLRVGLQPKTRGELGGSFLSDYRRSTRVPRQWTDGDSGLTNYIGHPIQGAASGFVWVQNAPSAPRSFTADRRYFQSRLRAMAWSAGYSLQFEVGPFSEASIGNVGLRPETAGWVDHVVTPTGGFVLMLGEDALDRFVVARLERAIGSPALRAVLRLALNPSRATANVAAMRAPWHRPDRPLR